MQEIRYYELVGKPVITADGDHLGRVEDLLAEPRDETPRVSALLVGPAALARRIGFKRLLLFRAAPPRQIPWSAVAEIGDAVRLRATRREIEQGSRRDGDG